MQHLMYFWNTQMQHLQHMFEGRWNTWNMLLEHLKKPWKHLKIIASIRNIQIKRIQHPPETHKWNIGNRPLQHTCTTIATYAISQSTFVTSIWNICNVTEPTNYTKLSKKIIHQADDLANLSPYNLVVREIMTDFKPTYIPAKIVISLAVTITNYIKVHVVNTSEFKHSYYKPSSNKSSRSI
jgi:hypothetical protein